VNAHVCSGCSHIDAVAREKEQMVNEIVMRVREYFE